MVDKTINSNNTSTNSVKSPKENQLLSIKRLNLIPIYLLINKKEEKKDSGIPFLVINNNNKPSIPFFLKYQDALKLKKNIGNDDYKIKPIGLQDILNVFTEILKVDEQISLAPFPIQNEIDNSSFLKFQDLSINQSLFEILKYESKQNKEILKIEPHLFLIPEFFCQEKCKRLINFFNSNNNNNNEPILNLFNFDLEKISDILIDMFKDIIKKEYSYEIQNINLVYIIKYDKNIPTNDFHFDDSILSVRIFLNQNFKKGGIEFKNNSKIRPSDIGDTFIYPGKITHMNRQLNVEEGDSYVLTIFFN